MTKPNILFSYPLRYCLCPPISVSSLITFFPLFFFFILSCSRNQCPRAFSFSSSSALTPSHPTTSVWGRLALGVDLRRTDIQRPVPCLQHWHFCQTLMAPLNRDVWREELPVSPPSSSSSSGSPLLRVRCTVADCSTVAHAGTQAQTYTGTELCIHTYTHLYSNIHIYLYWWCYSHMKCTTTHAHTQSHSSCWDAFKDPHRTPGIKLARVERQKSRLLDGTWLLLPPLLFLLSTLPPSKTPMSL